MPGGDRTGPAGLGPMTGRRAGYCSGSDTPGYATAPWNEGFGRGFGAGFGRGRGNRYWARATGLPGWQRTAYPSVPVPQKTQDADTKAEISSLREQLKKLQEKIDELKK
ncbi:MAG: DUF5320 domain-containing protein [Candidatus Aenigmarchaeota archaeon]|nr:DUF5320 domain-containing protein [Candidatus Aenigmarchaeota archaeon]